MWANAFRYHPHIEPSLSITIISPPLCWVLLGEQLWPGTLRDLISEETQKTYTAIQIRMCKAKPSNKSAPRKSRQGWKTSIIINKCLKSKSSASCLKKPQFPDSEVDLPCDNHPLSQLWSFFPYSHPTALLHQPQNGSWLWPLFLMSFFSL